MKRLISFGLALLMILGLCLTALPARAAEAAATGYYYSQLDETGKKIYEVLGKMSLKTGAHTVDLVVEGVLENKSYDQKVVMAAFAAGRDAFMLDNAALFYVDFDKLTVTMNQTGSSYSYTMGVGRDTTYFRNGFYRTNVDKAVNDFNAKVNEIAFAAMKKETLTEQIKAAYQGVMNATEYALEAQAKPENVNYVRTPYGALVRGQSVCEGYARALKAVLDEMGVESVLVQGYYSETIAGVLDGGPHMWNYVKMDDNRWYLLDATMDDRQNMEHLLLPGTDPLLLPYQPDGQISLSEASTTFSYPTLSPISYKAMTKAFEINDNGQMTYQGTGVLENAAEGRYILVSNDGSNWYYWENVNRYTWWNTYSIEPEAVDAAQLAQLGICDGYFMSPVTFQYAYVAVTATPRPTEFLNASAKDYYRYDITRDDFYDVMKIGEITEFTKAPPAVIDRGSHGSSVTDDEEFTVTVTYSENLKKVDHLASPNIVLNTTDPYAAVSGFQWSDQTNPNQVTFTLKVGGTFGQTTNYFLYLSGLVGTESNQTPDAIAYTKYNLPKFGCPKVSYSINEIHSNIPALISDSDLFLGDLLGADGQPIGENLPFELALVASELPATSADENVLTNEKLEDMVEETSGETVLASKTFDISLSLCSGQVSYIQGRRVKVFVPFPAGYNAESNVSFKAYHYNEAEKKMEQIDCVVVEGGIIMMCDAFSPFTVVAVEKEAVTKKSIMWQCGSNGGLSLTVDELTNDLGWIREGGASEITVTAYSGYRIESVTLNGQNLYPQKQRTLRDRVTLTVDYDMLKDSGNVLEAAFALQEVVVGEQPLVTLDLPDYVTITEPEGGWVAGMNYFTLKSEGYCRLLITEDNGETYTVFEDCTPGMEQRMGRGFMNPCKIIGIIQGDANNDGTVDQQDYNAVKAACLGQVSPNSLGDYTYDANRDYNVNILDMVWLKARLMGRELP